MTSQSASGEAALRPKAGPAATADKGGLDEVADGARECAPARAVGRPRRPTSEAVEEVGDGARGCAPARAGAGRDGRPADCESRPWSARAVGITGDMSGRSLPAAMA